MIGLFQSTCEVIGERHFEIFQLLFQSLRRVNTWHHLQSRVSTHLVKVIFALLWIVDGGLVAIVEEMASRNKTIAAVVPGTTCDEDAVALAEGL